MSMYSLYGVEYRVFPLLSQKSVISICGIGMFRGPTVDFNDQ